MPARSLTALPVFNEQRHIRQVLPEVIRHSEDVLVVDDGSTDGTAQALAEFQNVHVIHHETNQGYGAGLLSAFRFAQEEKYHALVTIDCDGQHEPKLIPDLLEALEAMNEHQRPADIVSGSRYLAPLPDGSEPPADRREINRRITAMLNECLQLELTDGFCGFKAYRVESLAAFEVTELGYAMPLQHWVQAVSARLAIREFPVPLVYLEEERSFGGSLDDARQRFRYYLEVLSRELTQRDMPLPAELQQQLRRLEPARS